VAGPPVVREHALTAAEQHRHDHDRVLVDEVLLDELPRQLACCPRSGGTCCRHPLPGAPAEQQRVGPVQRLVDAVR
jgi:hypothetical protein